MFQSTSFIPLQEGDISANQMAEHEGLVRWVVRQQWLGGLPFDDALHEGRIGLWRALCRYDPSRGVAFSSYAVVAITRSVWRAVANHGRTSLPVQPYPSLSPPDADDLSDLVHQSQVREILLEIVDHLPPRLRQIIIAYYGLDGNPSQTFVATGKTMGVSKQRIHVLHKVAILWLAHPAHSLPLRLLLERHRRVDYQKVLAQQRKAGPRPHRTGRGGARP